MNWNNDSSILFRAGVIEVCANSTVQSSQNRRRRASSEIHGEAPSENPSSHGEISRTCIETVVGREVSEKKENENENDSDNDDIDKQVSL